MAWLIVFCARCACCTLDASMRNICRRFAQDSLPMCKICAKFCFFPQCAIYVPDLHKIVFISPMHNICARFVQNCTSFPNDLKTEKNLMKSSSQIYFVLPFMKQVININVFCARCTFCILDVSMCNICRRFA